MSAVRLFLEPNDFVFFRDNKPFSGSESFSGFSRNMPLPSVIYGALRTHLLSTAGVNFAEYATFTNIADGVGKYSVLTVSGTKSELGSLGISGINLAQLAGNGNSLRETYYPVPQDITQAVYGEKKTNVRVGLRPVEATFKANFPHSYLQPLALRDGYERPEDVGKPETGGWLTETGFKDYLAGESLAEKSFCKGVALQQPEQRIGIAIDNATGCTKDGYFYILEGQRLQPGMGYQVDIMGLDAVTTKTLTSNQTYLFLGGESRFSSILPLSAEDAIPTPTLTAGRFKLVLTTPAIFDNGWLPKWITPDTGQGEYLGCKIQLVSAALGKWQAISGFDMALNQPKPIRRAVPPGSVYFFEVLAGDAQKLVQTLHGSSISDKDGQAGFGLVLAGSW